VEWKQDTVGIWVLHPTSNWDIRYWEYPTKLTIHQSSYALERAGIKETEPNRLSCFLQKEASLKGWINPRWVPFRLIFIPSRDLFGAEVYHPGINRSTGRFLTSIPLFSEEKP